MRRPAILIILGPALLAFLLTLCVTVARAEEQGVFITTSAPVVSAGEVFTVSTRVNIYPEEKLTFVAEFPLSEEVEFVDADPGFVYKPADPAVPFSFNSVSGTISNTTTVSYRLRLLPNTPKKAVLLYARIFFEGRVIAVQYEAVLADFQRRYLPVVLR